jgi:hypothetical protein
MSNNLHCLLQASIDFAIENGFNGGILTPIFSPLDKGEEPQSESHLDTVSPLILNSNGWNLVTPVLTPPSLRKLLGPKREVYEKQFLKEIGFAYHVKKEGFILVKLGRGDPETLGKLLGRAVKLNPYENAQLVVEVPIADSVVDRDHHSDNHSNVEREDQVRHKEVS